MQLELDGIMTASATIERLQQEIKELNEQVEKWRKRAQQLESERWGLIWT